MARIQSQKKYMFGPNTTPKEKTYLNFYSAKRNKSSWNSSY